ncbi:two-component sensor histidine kinase [Kibdelosporangium aridum]|uniref:histidine kinase n=1 Tax=Kibdelosporangium aridum TaxID=2030 RepID=A0A428ZU21_KIBAR|nr:histidine kinase [Kibdelosporangium aridum]RSM91463.1 two-component sensor histidine kinase [Kibdelosporangium aridum]
MRSDGRWAKRLPWWDGRIGLLLLDVAVAAVAIAFDLSTTRRLPVPETLYVVAACVAGLALLARRRFPFVVLIVVSVCLLAGVTLVPITVALYSVAARHGLSLATGVATVIVAASGLHPQFTDSFDVVSLISAFSLLVAAPVLGGLWMYQRAALLAALRGRAEEAERNRTLLADQAVLAERRRIAREMHDVVAHHVTAITLQAGALTLTPPDERTAKIGEDIRSSSVVALNELRGILGVLRDNRSEDAQLSGVGIPAAIRKLIGESAATVNLSLPDPWPEVPGDVGRAVYRIVQESLTNAQKHAPQTTVDATVTATKSTLTVTITNRLAPHHSGVPGSGYGLVGMRERVELAGGQLRTGPHDGRFEVVATFPLGRAA